MFRAALLSLLAMSCQRSTAGISSTATWQVITQPTFDASFPCAPQTRTAHLTVPAGHLTPKRVEAWACAGFDGAVVHANFDRPVVDSSGFEPVLRLYVPWAMQNLTGLSQLPPTPPPMNVRIFSDSVPSNADGLYDYDFRVESGPDSATAGRWGHAKARVGARDVLVVLALEGAEARGDAAAERFLASFHAKDPEE